MGNKEKQQKRSLVREQQLLVKELVAWAKQIKPARAAASPSSVIGLPELPSDFNEALFEEVILGPRRELTLKLNPLVWVNSQGHHGPAVTVRFGGIINFEEVQALFASGHHERSELGRLSYDAQHTSKPGDLYLWLEFERVMAGVVIHCHSLTVMEPESRTD